MSPLEQDIRDSLRAEAERLSEVRPLLLPPAAVGHRLRRATRAPGSRPWQAPVLAAAAIVLVAAALVTAKVLQNGSVVPATSRGPATAPTVPGTAYGAPRYYVSSGLVWDEAHRNANWVIIAADSQMGKTLGSYNLPKGNPLSWAASGAADDQTFVVHASVSTFPQSTVFGPARWYLVKIFPGSADPVRVTPLAIQATPATADASRVISIALSGDGSELAVVSNTGKSVGLGVYSVATGRLRHFWSAAISGVSRVDTPVTGPSWVGDTTVAFALIQTPDVRQEVRTLDVNSAGADLLNDSRVVWSQYVPPPADGKYGKGTPRTCSTPVLAGNGQAVVCATSSYSASTKRLSGLWLAYPLATPAQPRVIGSIEVPQGVKGFAIPNTVEWTNPSGTEVIGSWTTEVVTYSKNSPGPATTDTTYFAFIGGGKVREFPVLPASAHSAAW